jgi:probable phosphoglycerate mutase
MIANVFTDGGSRGNPGISGYGIVVFDDQKKRLYEESKYLGVKTNNEAEYYGLIAAVTWAVAHQTDFESINFYSDSQLLVRQQLGRYKVKAPHLKPLFDNVRQILSSCHVPYQFFEIRRELNQAADELANIAMDRKTL